MNLRQSASALEEPAFRWQFAAQATSVLGDHIAPVALAFAVLDVENSASAVGTVLAARIVPMVLVVLVGGVWADRLPRHAVMFAADAVRAGSQAFLAALVLSGHAALWQFVVLQALNGIASAFFQPASTGLTPLTVRAERLQDANALISLSVSAAVIAGPLIGGILVAVVGAGWGLGIDAATFAVSAVCLSRVRIPARAATAAAPAMLAALREGWSEVRARRWLMLGIGDLALFQLLTHSTYFVLGPVLAEQRLGGAATWGTIVTLWGVGAALGGAVALRFRPRQPLVASMLALAGVTPTMLLLGVSTSAIAIGLTGIAAGAGMVLGSILWDTTFQQQVPSDRLSRVAAYDWAGSMVLRPVGYVVVGPAAAAVGAGPTMACAAGALFTIQIGAACARSMRGVTPGVAPAPVTRG